MARWVVPVELIVEDAHSLDDAVVQAAEALAALRTSRPRPGAAVQLGEMVGGGSDAYKDD